MRDGWTLLVAGIEQVRKSSIKSWVSGSAIPGFTDFRLNMAVKKVKRIRGVIVWDFDNVLFETERYRVDCKDSFVKIGIPEEAVIRLLRTRKEGDKVLHVSLARFFRDLRQGGFPVSENTVRRIAHRHLVSGEYYSSKLDALLHRLSKKSFIHFVLSHGISSFQYKKIFVGCGKSFRRHFVKIMVTTRPKYLRLLKVRAKYPDLPLLFVDDTIENLELAKEQVPYIKTIYYSNVRPSSPLAELERKILRAAGYAK